MKRIYLKLASIVLYIGALIIVLEVNVLSLFSLKLLLLVIGGAIVLTLPYYSNKLSKKEISDIIGRKALEAGYIQTFILLFMCLSKQKEVESLFRHIALNCRPLLYGYCFYILMFNNEAEQETQNKEKIEVVSSEVCSKKCKEEIAVSEEMEALHMRQSCNDKEDTNDIIEKEIYAPCKIELTNTEINDKLRVMGLTKREAEIAYAIIKGMTNREIAEQYYVSEATVKKHVSHIFEKLGIQKREEIRWRVYQDDSDCK